YWDTDTSTTGNNSTTGASLGGSGAWSTAAANWWDVSAPTLQPWTDNSDAVFTGAAGTATADVVSANSLAFKTNGYTVNSGTVTMTGSPSNITVDPGVTATIGSTLAGSATMTKLGAGTLVLSNMNNINTATSTAGGWRIDAGKLRIAGDGSL